MSAAMTMTVNGGALRPARLKRDVRTTLKHDVLIIPPSRRGTRLVRPLPPTIVLELIAGASGKIPERSARRGSIRAARD